MNSKDWNAYVTQYSPKFGAFLQSYEWGEFQKALGRPVARIFLEQEGKTMLGQVVQMSLPLGQYYWYIPKGPLGNMEPNDAIRMLRDHLDGAMFLRLEPSVHHGLKRVQDMQPRATTILDLRKDIEEILAGMKSKTRYNIRLGLRKKVDVRFVDAKEYLGDFIRLMNQTKVRDGFSAHPTGYYEQLLNVLSDGEVRARLAMAFYEEIPIAANIIIDFDKTRTYLHGATSNLHRNVMAQYVLHHFLIEDAKKQGFEWFDFWGIAPQDTNEKSSWAGITRYKLSFGGEYRLMDGTFELPMKQLWYGAYSLAKRLRR